MREGGAAEVMFAGRKEGEAPGRTRGRQGGEGSGFSTPHGCMDRMDRCCRQKAKPLMNVAAASGDLPGEPSGLAGLSLTSTGEAPVGSGVGGAST